MTVPRIALTVSACLAVTAAAAVYAVLAVVIPTMAIALDEG